MVVAPDLGAVKLADWYAAVLNGPVVLVRKQRESGSAVSALDIAGDVGGRPAVMIDDMITTGATVEAAVGLLRAQRCTGHCHGRDPWALGSRRRQSPT